MELHDVAGFFDNLTDIAPAEIILLCDLPHQGDVFGRHLDEHPFLGLREHDLARRHSGLAKMDPIGVDDGAERARHLARCSCKACGPEIAAGEDLPGLRHGKDCIDEELFRVWVADLNARPVGSLRILCKVAGCERCAAKPVPACRGADQDKVAPRPFYPGGDVAVGFDGPDADDVHERVSRIGWVEDEFTTDDRHTDTVAVIPDPGDDVLKEVAVLLACEGAEVERVHQGDGPGAH